MAISMVRQFERLEQQTPTSVKTAVWGGLRVPHRVFRRRVIANYRESHPIRKLQLGCRGNLLSGWLSSDLNPVRSSGFRNVKRQRPGESANDNLRDIESHGRRISEEFNQLESLVVEAVKSM